MFDSNTILLVGKCVWVKERLEMYEKVRNKVMLV